jgi:acetyl esterase/lipase
MKGLKTLCASLLFAFSINLCAQQHEIPLWPGIAPGSENWTQKEVQYLNDQKQQMIRNVITPTLSAFLPDPSGSLGAAVIVAPGGAFRFLSWETEGTAVAEWLSAHGVAAFVLKYRLMNTGATQEEFQQALMALFRDLSAVTDPANTGKPEGDISKNKTMAEISGYGQEDGRQAIRLVRAHAVEWGIDPHKIGIIGFSAGGMVALGTLLQHSAESRPDFAGAIYTPWSENPVPDDAPPLFILVAGDDRLTAPGSVQMYTAWRAAGKEAELHVYSKGGHGFGMQKRGLPVDNWIEIFGEWLEGMGMLSDPNKN